MATSDSGQQGDAVRVRLLGLQISYRKIKAKSWHSTRLQREHKCSHTHTHTHKSTKNDRVSKVERGPRAVVQLQVGFLYDWGCNEFPFSFGIG